MATINRNVKTTSSELRGFLWKRGHFLVGKSIARVPKGTSGKIVELSDLYSKTGGRVVKVDFGRTYGTLWIDAKGLRKQ